MLRNDLKIALRNLRRSPGYTAINVIGLAIGVACCLTITLYVLDELSYDRFHEKAGRIYRVVNERYAEGEVTHVAMTPPAYAQLFKQEFPEVEEAVRFFDLFRVLVQHGDKKFFEPKLYLADSTVFNVFSLPLQKGDPETALTAPNTLVIDETLATKYFGDEDPVGKTLKINGNDWTVTGVFEEIPRQSHLKLQMIGSFQTMYTVQTDERLTNFNWQQFFTYVLLREGVDPRDLERRLPQVLDRAADLFTTEFGFTYDAHLQPLTDMHLRSGHLTFDWGDRDNITYVWIFSGIALFVLLIACFNFMNLSTARATNRAREVGMRKVIGARRAQLIGQFLGESTLMAFIALALAILITQIILPSFNPFIEKELAIPYGSGWAIAAFLTLGLLLGIVAGSYPALYLSAFRPAKVLKGELTGSGLTSIRRTLVVAQFVITIALMIGTAVVLRQLEYTRNVDLGFRSDLLVKVPLVEDMGDNVEAIKEELLRYPTIEAVTASWGSPGGFLAGDGVHLPGRDAQWGLRVITTDHEFISTYGMRMAAGRDFSPEFSSDPEEAFIINEAAAAMQGWTAEEAIGKELIWDEWTDEVRQKRGRIIGVVENFHYGTLRDTIEPVMITLYPVYGGLTIRIRAGSVAAALAAIESEWDGWVESWPFEYTFLEEELADQYLKDERLARVLTVFAGLAVIIACLGLFGLTSFLVGKRTKEIGIRKVMGASVQRIVLLLSGDIALLVALAFLIATPFAYLAANQWLDDFAYRVSIGPNVFVLAGILSLAVAIVTVSFHTIRAALSNPIESLRFE